MKKYSVIMLFLLILVLFLFGLEKRPINAQIIAPEPISMIDKNEFIVEPEFPTYNIPLDKKYQNLVMSECKKYNLSETLVYAIIETESNFNPKYISNTGDYGLFQLNKNTYPWIADMLQIKNFNPLNPEHNIKAGIYYINFLRSFWQNEIDNYPDEEIFKYTILSYNRGLSGAYRIINRGGVDRNKYLQAVIENKTKLEINK